MTDPEDSHLAESMDEETSAYSMSETGESVRRGKKRVRRNISVEQRDGGPLDVIRGMEKKLVKFLCRAENKVSKGALTFILEQFGEVRTQAVEAIARSERAAGQLEEARRYLELCVKGIRGAELATEPVPAPRKKIPRTYAVVVNSKDGAASRDSVKAKVVSASVMADRGGAACASSGWDSL